MTKRRGGDDDLAKVLRDLDRMVSGVLKDMDRWEAELHRTAKDGQSEEVVEVAGRGSKLGRTARDVRSRMATLKGSRGKAIEEQGLDGLSSGIEAKCDVIQERLDRALQEVMAMQESLGDRIAKAMDTMDDLSYLDIYPDVNSDDELKKEFEKKDKGRKI